MKIHRRLYGEGQVCAPTVQTSLKFRDFDQLYPCQFSTNHFQTWQFTEVRFKKVSGKMVIFKRSSCNTVCSQHESENPIYFLTA